MTLHAAKGLEFENVFIIGLEDGILPHERSCENDDEIEEERRLFFVGITRAKSELTINYCRYRNIRGQFLRSVASKFLYELGLDISQNENPVHDSWYETDDFEDDFEEDIYQSKTNRLSKNQLVRHGKFGLGRVQQYTDMGENSTVVVKFNSGRTKTLMVKYANLELL
jgi:DNA helicase-2/ATP-dependent DNA helicase PcrA